MPFGYNGRILHVDLTHGSLEVEAPPKSFYRKYMGGSAMGLYYILNEMPKGADALGPDNVLTLMCGVTTGAAISGQSRINANAKSPISGAIGDSQGGGYFPAELKFCGLGWDRDQRQIVQAGLSFDHGRQVRTSRCFAFDGQDHGGSR